MNERILAACDKALARGYRVEAGAWGVAWNPKRGRWAPLKTANKRLCPIGALVLMEQPPPGEHRTVPEAAVAILGVDIHWVVDFQGVFDGLFMCDGAAADAARAVAQTLVERLAQGAHSPSG